MKAPITQNEIMHAHSSSGELATHPHEYWNEERMFVASFIIGNLIFWGSLFYLFTGGMGMD